MPNRNAAEFRVDATDDGSLRRARDHRRPAVSRVGVEAGCLCPCPHLSNPVGSRPAGAAAPADRPMNRHRGRPCRPVWVPVLIAVSVAVIVAIIAIAILSMSDISARTSNSRCAGRTGCSPRVIATGMLASIELEARELPQSLPGLRHRIASTVVHAGRFSS